MNEVKSLALDLHHAPHTLVLFGLAGSGKSFVGELIARQPGWHLYHADEDITAEMQQALAEQRPFTDAMRDEYFALIAEKLLELQKHYSHLLVTQAIYKQRHRDYLLQRVQNMELLYIAADDEVIRQRLQAREEGISLASAEALRQDFEAPAEDVKRIMNNGEAEDVIRQLNQYYGRKN